MTAPVLHRPTTELVALAWLSTLSELSGVASGTTLPADSSRWSTGFVQVLTVGGSPHANLPIRQPVVSVDCWAAATSGNRPPWGRANDLAEIVRDGTELMGGPTDLTIAVGSYAPARLLRAQVVTEPRRITGDPASFARYQLHLALSWTALPA